MSRLVTAYVIANAERKLRFGITQILLAEIKRVRRLRGWGLAECVWTQDFSSRPPALAWLVAFRRLGQQRRRDQIAEHNPLWQDVLRGRSEFAVLAGTSTFSEYSESWCDAIADRRARLLMLGLDPSDFDDTRDDSGSGGSGGVGAVRRGWPHFPTPRLGRSAQAWPAPEQLDHA